MNNDRNKPEKGRVLVVDDLPDVQATLLGLLMDKGYDTRFASNKFEALQILSMEQFHIAILDIRLDETDEDNKDGLLLMREIKSLYPNIATIILTGHADVRAVREALQPDSDGISPAFGFIEKSEIDEIPNCVDRAYAFVQRKTTSPIEDIIKQGENDQIEFKSSIRWDYKKGGVNKEIQLVIAKSIAGMLNYHGGTLLVGVADNGTVLGIDQDLVGLRKPDSDGFQLMLTEIVRNYLGLEHMEYIHVRFEIVNGKRICVISIEPRDKPVFLSPSGISEFWVRVGNSTRQLDVKEATMYIQTHWGKKNGY
jgi:CheY-like chemotaxis protein